MYRVEMAVELQGTAGFAAVEADDDRRRRRMIGDGTLDREAVRRQQVGEAVGDGAALAGAAGHGDQLPSRVEQTLSIDGPAETFGNAGVGVHDGKL